MQRRDERPDEPGEKGRQGVLTDTPSRVEAVAIDKSFETSGGSVRVLDNVSVSIAPAGFTCLLGPSGCGKSTLLNMIAGFIEPDQGELLVDGQPVRGPGPERGVVFQEYALFPWLTAAENIAFGPAGLGLKGTALRQLVDDYLRLVGLEGFGDHYPNRLSGGMRQRVALARALANRPRVLLMDEPFGALDALTRQVLQEELLRIWLKERTTIVFVTHSIRESIFLGTSIIVMTRRPGRVKQVILIPMPYPRDPSSQEFLQLEQTVEKLVREEVER
jgi:ABC-type nitrate/sulfonate/bicarbonate transport system ATPase subunit